MSVFAWGWGLPDAETPTLPAIQHLVIADAESPLFEGVPVPDERLALYNEPDATMQFQADSSLFTGNIAGWTDVTEDGANPGYPWIVTWEGTEDAFYSGGTEAPGGPRVLFLGRLDNDPGLHC